MLLMEMELIRLIRLVSRIFLVMGEIFLKLFLLFLGSIMWGIIIIICKDCMISMGKGIHEFS